MNITNITVDGNATLKQHIVCYAPLMIDSMGIWQNQNVLDYSLPTFLVQWMLVITVSRAVAFLLKPLRQPRIMSEILGGIVFGPSVIGMNTLIGKRVFPPRSFLIFDTMANIGLLFFLFILGLEMDLTVIRRSGRRVIAIAIGGLAAPFAVLCVFSVILHELDGSFKLTTFMFFIPLALSVTAFPVLARILAELKLLHVELGRVAMTSALICDYCVWLLLLAGIALGQEQTISLTSLWMLISGVIFAAFCLLVIRPAFYRWLQYRAHLRGEEDKNFSELTICLVLAGAMLCAFITDAVGLHFASGAFIFGLAIPNGSLASVIVDKVEDMVNGYLLPIFFFFSGMKTRIYEIQGAFVWGILILITFLAWISKFAGTFFVARFYEMPFREAIMLGCLMNTKGLMEMVVLNIGWEQNIIDNKSYTMMVITAVVMTGIVMPAVAAIYKSEVQFRPHKWRTIESTAFTTDAYTYLEILACIHNPKINVPSILNIVRASRPSQESLLSIFLLQLNELTNRSSAIHIAQANPDSHSKNWGSSTEFDHMVGELIGDLEESLTFASIQTLTTVSSYSTIYEDICNVAKDKGTALIILPFHKQKTVDEEMDTINPKFQLINQQVQANAPCSVGILIERGVGSSSVISTDSYNIAALFFGGPDDREAVSYGLKMSRHPSINLTIVRFLAYTEMDQSDEKDKEGGGGIETADDIFLAEVRRHRQPASSICKLNYLEKMVQNSEQTIEEIGLMGDSFDFFVVGKNHEVNSSVIAGIGEWNDCPEIGAIGDLLASTDFKSKATALVVQQYSDANANANGTGATATDDTNIGNAGN